MSVNNVSSKSSSSEFRNVPYSQPSIENIGIEDLVIDKKGPKTIMTFCTDQFKGKSQVSSGKSSITKRKVEKDGSKPLEPHTNRDKKSDEIPLKRKMLKERGTTSFDNTPEPGNFDTSKRISFSERIGTKWKTFLDENIKEKIIHCSICFETWLVKLKLVSKINLFGCKCTRYFSDKEYPKKSSR